MILPFHVAIALSSMLCTGLAYFFPSKTLFRASYVLIFLTIASGTWLVVSTSAHLLQACLSGLAYLGIVAYGMVAAHRKWALANVEARKK